MATSDNYNQDKDNDHDAYDTYDHKLPSLIAVATNSSTLSMNIGNSVTPVSMSSSTTASNNSYGCTCTQKVQQQTENITIQQNISDDVGPVLLMCPSFSKDSQLSILNNNNVNKQDRERP